MAESTSRQLSVRALWAIAAVFALMLPALWWSWTTPAPYADLSRIGRFSESSFGWRGAQPAITPAALRTAPVAEADLLVIGDSFSAERQWQSVLVDAGWRVATWHWNSVDRVCLDLEPWLRRQGYRGHTVVLQVVERHLPGFVAKSSGCQAMPALRATAGRHRDTTPLTRPPEPAINWQARLDTGAITAWHDWLARRDDQPFVVREGEHVRVASVPRGCKLFSHSLCRRALFLADDLDLPPALPEHVAALPHIAASTPGLRIVWLVTPNKSTVYLQPERAAQLSAAMQTHVVDPGLGPDLFSAFAQRRDVVRDFYFPNDTHLSTAGYLEMGRLVASALGSPPAH